MAAQAVTKAAFETGDGVQVLRRAGVLVLGAGEPGRTTWDWFARAVTTAMSRSTLASTRTIPAHGDRTLVGSYRSTVPVPRGPHQEHWGPLPGLQFARPAGSARRDVRGQMGLDEPTGAGQLLTPRRGPSMMRRSPPVVSGLRCSVMAARASTATMSSSSSRRDWNAVLSSID